MNSQKIFVYGTLKNNEPNHHWLVADDDSHHGHAELLGPGITLEPWPLVVVTQYNIPMLLGL